MGDKSPKDKNKAGKQKTVKNNEIDRKRQQKQEVPVMPTVKKKK